MKQMRTRLFLALLLSLPTCVHVQAREMSKQNPLHVVLQEAKRMHIDMTNDDYQLCKKAMKCKELSADELQRIADICDQVLGSAKDMSETEIEACRTQLAEQLTEHTSTRAPREPLTSNEFEPIIQSGGPQDGQSQTIVNGSGGNGGSNTQTFITDNGIVQTTNNTISIIGGDNISTIVDGDTIKINSTGSTPGDLDFNADSGTANAISNAISFEGGNVIDTLASGDTVTTRLVDGSSAGQVLIADGSGSGDPIWANITSADNSIIINEGPNSIDLVSNVDTAIDFQSDSGTAEPSGGAININGGDNITTSASGSDVTVSIPLCSEIEVDLLVCEGIRASNSGNVVNFDATAINMAAGTGDTGSTRSNGFNFAAQDATAESGTAGPSSVDNGCNGFNFAAGNQVSQNFPVSGGVAVSDFTAVGFNFASGGGRAENSSNSFPSPSTKGFNFAAGGATAISGNGSSGFIFASGENTSITNRDTDSFTVAVAGSQFNDPPEGVNFYINNSGNSTSNLRFHDLPGAIGTETFLVIDPITNSVRVSDTSPTSIPSSRRFKDDITDLDDTEVRQLQKLEPVSFTYKKDDSNRIQFGLIAEDVAEIFPELVTYDSKGQVHGLKYHMLTPLLVKYVQMQEEEISSQQDTIKQLKKENAEYNKKQVAQEVLIQNILSRLAAIEES